VTEPDCGCFAGVSRPASRATRTGRTTPARAS
jgi:hypothetical protein